MPSSVEDLDLDNNSRLSCINGLAPLASCVKLKQNSSGLTKVDGMPRSVEVLDLNFSSLLTCVKGPVSSLSCTTAYH